MWMIALLLNGCAQACGAVVQSQSSWLSADEKWEDITSYPFWRWHAQQSRGSWEQYLNIIEVDKTNFARSGFRRHGIIGCCLFGTFRLLPATRSAQCAQRPSANASAIGFPLLLPNNNDLQHVASNRDRAATSQLRYHPGAAVCYPVQGRLQIS